jgi:transcriptional regulator with XRE-family HTH domain
MANPNPDAPLTRGAVLLIEGTRPPPPSSGLTQSEVAERLGVHRSLVSHWAMGVSRPKLDHAVKLQEIMGIPVEAWTENVTKVPDDAGAEG